MPFSATYLRYIRRDRIHVNLLPFSVARARCSRIGRHTAIRVRVSLVVARRVSLSVCTEHALKRERFYLASRVSGRSAAAITVRVSGSGEPGAVTRSSAALGVRPIEPRT